MYLVFVLKGGKVSKDEKKNQTVNIRAYYPCVNLIIRELPDSA